ncbi:hypothetical protein HKX48_007476 [Thoreauomyces humboldtii]|nr:hypothetical protein HKX48_007476 [Thoreauomyces humboldtii]
MQRSQTTVPEGYSIRQATPDDLSWVKQQTDDLQWNQGKHDIPTIFATDAPGFLIAHLSDGQPVGCIVGASHAEEKFGFIGLYIVVREHRGKGVGVALWNRAMERFAEYVTVELDGVVAHEATYRKGGFETVHRDLRYKGVTFPAPESVSGGMAIVPLTTVPLSDLVVFDARYFPVPRQRFLEAWVQAPEAFGLVAVDDGRILGFGVIRPARTGFRIGPLFAELESVARSLLLALADSRTDKESPVFLDTPDVNKVACGLLERSGMVVVSECARMYKGSPAKVDISGIYATTSLAIG